MKPTLYRNLTVIFFAACSLGSHLANASQLTWDADGRANGVYGGNGIWNSKSALWEQDGKITQWDNQAGLEAVFTGNAGTVRITKDVTAGLLTFDTADYLVAGKTLTLSGDAPAITANANATISAKLAGTSGFTKYGTGTLTLSASNTYSGGTVVNGGILKAGNAAAFGTGDIRITSGTLDIAGKSIANGITLSGGNVINSAGSSIRIGNINLGRNGNINTKGSSLIVNGTLAGSGSITGDVVINGTLTIGNSPGLLSVSGDASLEGLSASIFEIGGKERGISYDALDVGGTLFLDALIQVVLIDGFDSASLRTGDSFDLINWGSLVATDFDVGTQLDLSGVPLSSGLSWDTSGFLSNGTITVVPEPSHMALFVALGVAAILLRRRRR